MSFKILSIDGGGVRAIGSVALFKKHYSIPSESFDAFTGTSAGAIIAILCAMGKSAEEIEVDCINSFQTVFKKRHLLSRLIPFGSVYRNKNLRSALKMVLGEYASKRMCDLPKPVYIPVTDFQEMDTKVFDKDDKAKILDVLEMTCSAPYYFSPVSKRYGDGGMWANNPSLVGVLGAKRHFGLSINDIELLSLGHHEKHLNSKRLKYAKYYTIINWAFLIFDFFMVGSEDGYRFFSEQLGLKKFQRFVVHTSDLSIDDPKKVPEIIKRWDNMVSSTEMVVK